MSGINVLICLLTSFIIAIIVTVIYCYWLHKINNDVRNKGCSTCPYAGHIELKECPNAYTEKAKECKNYNHEQFM